MKKFQTVTELEVVRAAHAFYLDIALRQEECAKELGGENPFANERARRAWAREHELHEEILRLERKNG